MCRYCGQEFHLRSFVEEFPDASKLHQRDLDELRTVPVSLILGSFSIIEQFGPDWTPKKFADRDRVDTIIQSIQRDGYNPKPRDIIHLVNVAGKYWVASNGYHRIIAAKFLNLPTIQATVSVLTARNSVLKKRLLSFEERL